MPFLAAGLQGTVRSIMVPRVVSQAHNGLRNRASSTSRARIPPR